MTVEERLDLEYTYQDYLEAWQREYGDATTGDTVYYERNEPKVVTINKLTEEAFNLHKQMLLKSNILFYRARQGGSEDGMDAALAQGFPHELQLLL